MEVVPERMDGCALRFYSDATASNQIGQRIRPVVLLWAVPSESVLSGWEAT